MTFQTNMRDKYNTNDKKPDKGFFEKLDKVKKEKKNETNENEGKDTQ